MTWQDELRRLDTALAAGDISQSEHQEQRDAVLSIAAGSRAGSPFDTQLTLRNQPISAIAATTAAADQLDSASPAPVTTAADEPTPATPADADGDAPSTAESVEHPVVQEQATHEKATQEQTAEQQTTQQQSSEQQATTAEQPAESTPKPAAEPPPVEATAVTPLPAGSATMTAPPTAADSSSVATTGVPMAAGSTTPTSKQSATDNAADASGQTLGARLGAVMQDHPNVHQSDQDSMPLPMTTDTMARPGPYAGRAEEVFNAQSARPRRKLLLPIVLTVLLLAAIAAGVVWFLSPGQATDENAQQDTEQNQPQDAVPPPATGDQPTLPALPGEPVPHPEAMSRDAAVTAGVLGAAEAQVFEEHEVAEILFRGSADADNSFGVLVGVAPSEDAALASAEALAFGQTELGLEAVAMEELPGQVRVFEQVGEEQSIYRAVYVSGVHVVRLGVAGPTANEAAPVDAAFRTLADETLQTLEQN